MGRIFPYSRSVFRTQSHIYDEPLLGKQLPAIVFLTLQIERLQEANYHEWSRREKCEGILATTEMKLRSAEKNLQVLFIFSHCVKYRNFIEFPRVEILWKPTVSTESWAFP